MSAQRLPVEMRIPPPLPVARPSSRPRPRTALLVNPFYPKDPHASFGKHVLTPTLALTSLAAVTPESWDVALWDENLLQGPCPSDPLPEVVGITVHITFARRAYQLADRFRALGSKVILGGLHVLACPEEAARHADAISLGNGVTTWPQILADVAEGRLRSRYCGDFRTAFGNEPSPRRAVLPRSSFLTTTSIIATRGCHNRCTFCYLATKGLVQPYQTRPVEDVVEEIRQDGQPYAVFLDNNLGADRGYLHSLCRALEPLGRIWSAAVTIDVTDDPSLIRQMAESGCTGVFVGFETLSNENLADSRKRSPAAEDYARRVALFHEHGIQVNGSFVFGFDHDDASVFERTVRWIEANRLECATFHILTPYPGTPLFSQLDKEGRILTRDWDLYDTGHAVFEPRRMTVKELEDGYAWAYETLFSLKSIWERRPRSFSAAAGYFGMSLLYKKSNPLWRFLIRNRLTALAWRPLVEASRRRHLRLRKVSARSAGTCPSPSLVTPGV